MTALRSGRASSTWFPVALLALGLAGCSSSTGSPAGSHDAPPKNPAAVTLPGDWKRVMGPLDAYIYSGSDPVRLEAAARDATERRTEGCMRARGWRYTATTASVDQVRRDLLTLSLTSAIADDSFRKKFGYGVTAGLRADTPRDELNGPNASYYASLSRQQQDVYDKDFPRCAGESTKKVGLDSPAWATWGKLRTDLASRIASEESVVAGQKRWQECMSAAGYRVTSPVDASQDLDRRAQPLYARGASEKDPEVVELVKDELRQAAHDWHCRQTQLLPPYEAVRNRLESAAVEDNQELLLELRDSLSRAGSA